jgi:hypothetical protein
LISRRPFLHNDPHSSHWARPAVNN